MTSFTDILNAAVAVGASLNTALMTALRDNPRAVAECDPTAPVNASAWHPYNKVEGDDTIDGKFYDFATNGVQASVETPVFETGWEYRVRIVGLSNNAGTTGTLQVDPFRQTGAAYNGVHQFGTAVPPAHVVAAWIEFPTAPLTLNAHAIRTLLQQVVPPYANSTGAGTVSTTDFIPNFATAQRIGKARISWSSGSIDAGQMFLDKRRLYI